MNDLYQQIASISPQQKRALLTQLLKKSHAPLEYPLSYGQHALWFLHQLAPNSGAYNEPLLWRIHGKVQVPALQRAFQMLVARHPMLRTIYPLRDNRPVQRVLDQQSVPFKVIDAQAWTEHELNMYLVKEVYQPIDLECGPVVRAQVLTCKPDQYLLMIVAHHISIDFWSYMILTDELFQFYATITAQRPATLPPLKASYQDFVRWQTDMVAGPTGERHWLYWQKQLQGPLPVLQLPTDRVRSSQQTFSGAACEFMLDQPLSHRLMELAQEQGVTLYTLLLTAFQILLHRYTGQDDILVNSPVNGRSQAVFEGIVGYFVNPVVLRSHLTDNPSFITYLHRTYQSVVEALDHQDYPFPLLVARLQPQRDPGRAPLCDVSFVMEQVNRISTSLSSMSMVSPHGVFATGGIGAYLNLGGLDIEPMNIERRQTKFDLELSMTRTGERLSGLLQYNTDLFNADPIVALGNHYQRLLEEIVSHPECRVRELPLLSPEQHQQILWEWNRTSVLFPQEPCLHQLFETQVVRTPDAIAIISGAEQITYSELNYRANQLAFWLRQRGVGPEVLVGICVERSVEMLVGLLGILKAGGAYLPLDPTYPQERLAFQMADAQVRWLVCQMHLLTHLPTFDGQLVCLDTDWDEVAQGSGTSLTNESDGATLAYVIYTSGSTGQPKGVQIPHRAVGNFLASMQQQLGITAQERLLAVTTLSFDIAALELFLPLSVGASLVLLSRAEVSDGSLLAQTLSLMGATVMQATPTTWHLLLASGWSGSSRLKGLCGGEALPTELARQMRSKMAALWNMYGPTETTIWSTIFPVDPTGEQTSNPVALGRPIANTQVYVLDSFLHPVVPGVIGELYIGGLGVARGYMNRPHLTAERFVPHPYSSEPGARLYRTGDQVRYRTDGVLEYLGRIDQQVKVRGHRIELGEIEAILTTHPAVRQSVVMVREDTPGDQRLVAYVVANSPEDINHHELHIHMQRKLPNYMLPSAYVRLESLPLTPNGKLDRRMLSSLIPTSSPQQEESVPLTTVEELLANIWRQVLGIEQISRHDNFFELGGHSLLVTQVAVRIRSLFQVDLPLQALFTFPTLSELARYVLETQRQKQDLLLPPLERGLQTEHIPLSFAQQRLWFLAQLEPDSTHYTIPGALRLSGHLVLAALEQSLQAVIKRHDVLRTTFHLVESQPIQVIGPVETLPPFSLPLIDLSPLSVQQQELQVQSLARQEADAAFDLTQGPLWRSHVLRLSSQEHVMLLSFHHIIFDGWSKDVLIRELRAHYTAYLADKEPQISPLPLQYADYAIWQRQWLQGEILEQRLVYWKKQLANLPTVSLPTDYPRPAVQSHKGRQHIFVLPGELLISLRQLSRREEVTLFMTLLVAFQVLVARYSRQYDIVVGTPIAHRTHMETEGLIGFFVNTLVLRTDLSDEPTVRDCLRRIRQVCLEAYAHQDVPFEQVVEALQPRRDLSHAPLFQLLFALENTPDEPLELPDLQLHIQEGELSTARFDLELNMRETRDGLQGVLTYSTDLFTSETIQRFARHYRQLLEGLLANTSQPVSTLSLLSDEEQQQVLETWNTLPPDDQQEQCLHQRYLEQVLRTPDAIVVVSEEEQISYQVLDQRANQLANALRKRGVGSEVKVGLYVERSVDMLIGMLGVLKAGGGYVPLDPSYPDERLAFLLDDAQPRLLLTQQQFLGRALAWKGERMCLDTDWDQLAQEPDICPENTATVENLAYVIYTSGSSGQPKGVQISHRNVERLLRVCQAHFHFDEHDTWTCFHSFAFDFSVWELWGPLVHGSRLVLVPYWVSRSPVAFVDLLQQHQVSVLNQTPSAFRQLLWAERKRSRRQGERLALRLIIFGGEALEHTEVQNWFELYGDQQPQLFNMYGITETTVHVTVHRLLQADGTALVGSRIGRPLADLQAYILDPRQQLMPPGVPGELYIGGAGLACGYLNRPELTAERFVPHPWGNEPGARLYRTGDLARYRSDGILEYLGRLDRQVKVRGYRIELGEIEAALNMHPAVQQSVVVMREDVPGDQRLVAYLVTASQELASSHDLRTHLHNHLPDYMLPASYVYLAHLPLTANGKLDRQALPLPGATGSSSQEEFVAPRTALEEVLGGIWQQALGLERVSIHDNFFELGGHSLLATQVVNQINALFQVDLPLRTFFTVRTLANLADLLITYEVVPGQIETIAQSYQEIEHMSASEIRAMLESN